MTVKREEISAPSSAHVASHAALHENVIGTMAHSHAALDEIRKLETEVRMRKALLRTTLTNELTQKATAMKGMSVDVARLVDDLIG